MFSLPDTFPEFPEFPRGEVWLAGAGPGDPRLLTLLALHALSQAEVIVHDALVDKRVLALASSRASLIPVGKRGGQPSPRQRDINAILVEQASLGHRVLRLKGGDPFVFGRGWDEAIALADAGVYFRIIPGLTSGLTATALAGIPATTRETNPAVVLAAGHRAEDGSSRADWEALGRLGQPILLYMPLLQLPDVAIALQRGGLAADTPAAFIQSASKPDARVVETTLARLVEDATLNGVASPTIVVIGAIAGLRSRLRTYLVDWP